MIPGNTVSSGATYATHGKWLFFNNSGDMLYAIHQAGAGAGPANDFSIFTVNLLCELHHYARGKFRCPFQSSGGCNECWRAGSHWL